MSEICLTEMYRDCGISDEVLRRGEEVLKKLNLVFHWFVHSRPPQSAALLSRISTV